MKSLLKKLVPSHLHHLIFKEDDGGQDETRQYNMDAATAHFVQPVERFVLVSTKYPKHDSKYLAQWKSLSFREQEVLALACMACKNFEIARLLDIADASVKTHWQSIFRKFDLRDRHDIRDALRDWDFENWWEERHRRPVPTPHISTRR